MKIHPRTLVVAEARRALVGFMLDLEKKHDLTYGEMFSLYGDAIANLAKYQIRSERHPEDPDKKGDEA
jgi:hypothetical protein